MTPATFAPATVGAAVRYWRRVRELSQRGLASKVGRSQSWLSAVEIGRIVPSLRDATALAEALNVQLTQLLPGQEASP